MQSSVNYVNYTEGMGNERSNMPPMFVQLTGHSRMMVEQPVVRFNEPKQGIGWPKPAYWIRATRYRGNTNF